MKRFLWVGLVLCLAAMDLGCGDTFRPIIVPNPPAFPDPRSGHSVVAINNNNGNNNQGTILQIDVSGDTERDVVNLGYAPVHMVQQTATQVLVVNQASGNGIGESLMKLSFFGGGITPSTISLPAGSAPNFVAVAPNNTTAYVSLPGNGTSTGSIAQVNTNQNVVTQTKVVGTNPVAMAVTPDNSKLYVVNQADNTISSFNTVDLSARTVNYGFPLNSPLWIVSRSDNQRLYVLNGNGTVATIDPTTQAGTQDSVIAITSSLGTGVSSMLYDGNLNRLYVPLTLSSGNAGLAILDVSPPVPQLLTTVTLSSAPAAGVAVAALPNGSRAYAASNGPAQTTTISSISSVTGDGVTAQYTYDPASVSGPPVQIGMSLTISSNPSDGFDGTLIVTSVSAGQFDAANSSTGTSSVARTATGNNFLPQVTVINTAGNTVKTTINMPAVPAPGNPYEAPICSSTRFRFSMAAGGDSSRVYMATCDGGGVNVIRTSDDTYLLNLSAPPSALPAVPPSSQPPPQNPVFLIAGP